MFNLSQEAKSSEEKVMISAKLLIYDKDQENFLIIKRSLNHNHNPGLWELPGGKIMPSELIKVGLNREVMEETNLFTNLDNVDITTLQSRKIIDQDSSYDGFVINLLAAFIQQSIDLNDVQLSQEHTDKQLIKINPSSLQKQTLTPETELILKYFLDNVMENSYN